MGSAKELEDNWAELTALVDQLIASLKDNDGDSLLNETAHDMQLIYNTALQSFKESTSGNGWHNAAFDVLMERIFSPDAVTYVVSAHDLEEAEQRMHDFATFWFKIGHAIGEGPEHIKKCKCGRARGVGATS